MPMTTPATFTLFPHQPLNDLRKVGPNSDITVKDAKTGRVKEILGSNGETLISLGYKKEAK